MDTTKWRPTPSSGENTMDGGDWRTTLHPDSRQRIVNKIMDTLKRHLPYSGQEGLNECRKIAVRIEEKIFTAANSQSDYLRRISLKMLTMETKSQNMPNTGNTSKPPDPGSQGMQNQVRSQGQSIPVPLHSNQSQERQQLLPQSVPNNSGDWRTTLQPDSRQRIVNKIMDTLKRHLPFSGQEGLNELRKIAVRFEEKIFTAASSQSDYLRRISLKMLTMETKSQNMPNTGNTSKPPDPGSHGMQNQVHSQGQSIPVPLHSNQSQARQQLLPKSVPNNSGDWRTTVQPDSRQRIVNKIMDTLMRHLPFSGQEGLNELRKIAVRFEEKIFTAASSQVLWASKTKFTVGGNQFLYHYKVHSQSLDSSNSYNRSPVLVFINNKLQ